MNMKCYIFVHTLQRGSVNMAAKKNCVQEHGKKDGQFMSAETWMSRSAVITNCYETVLLYMSESKKG